MFQKVKGQTNVANVATTKDGNVIVGGHTVAVMKQCDFYNDPNLFFLSFVAHGRCMTPQRLAVIKELRDDASVRLNKNNDSEQWFVVFDGADVSLNLGNNKSKTNRYNLSDGFENTRDTTPTGRTVRTAPAAAKSQFTRGIELRFVAPPNKK